MTYTIYTISSIVIIAIPVINIVSNEIKEAQFENPYPTNDLNAFI